MLNSSWLLVRIVLTTSILALHSSLTILLSIAVISARLRKVEESIRQQYELHQMQLQREQIQIKGVQDEIQRQSILHAQQMDREREVFCA